MSNTMLSSELVVHDAAAMISDRSLIANLSNRSIEQKFSPGFGKTVNVSVPAQMTGELWNGTGSISSNEITETSTAVTLEYYAAQRINITEENLALDINDFHKRVTVPALDSVIGQIETYGMRRLNGFNGNLVGTAGTNPSTHAHIAAAEKTIFDQRHRDGNLASIINSTTNSSFRQLQIFNSLDFGSNRPAGLANGTLGQTEGIEFFRSSFAADAFDDGDTAGTVLTNNPVVSTNSLPINTLTATTGTIYEGTSLTIADDSSATRYTVTADATIATNAVTLSVTPALDTTVANDKVVTFETEVTQNYVFDPDALAFAILPLSKSSNTVSASYNNIGISIVEGERSTANLSQYWTFAAHVGAKITQPKFGCVFQG